MLAKLRKESRSIITMVLFGILVVVFVFGFGTSGFASCAGQRSDAARVGTQGISEVDLRYGWALLVGDDTRRTQGNKMRIAHTANRHWRAR